MAYGARLESGLGETPQGFKSPILRHVKEGTFLCPLLCLYPHPRWRVRAAKGARLESVCGGNFTVGSNPTATANFSRTARERPPGATGVVRAATPSNRACSVPSSRG